LWQWHEVYCRFFCALGFASIGLVTSFIAAVEK